MENIELKKEMLVSKKTQRALAEETEISLGTINRIVNGETKPKSQQIAKISQCLGIYDDPDKIKKIFL